MSKRKTIAILGPVAAIGAAWALTGSGQASGTNYPADKATVSASDTQVMTDSSTSNPAPQIILTAKLRTSTPEDLGLAVTSECGVTTNLTTPGASTAQAEGKVRMWITIGDANDNNQIVVPVDANARDSSGNPAPDDGKVVFCRRNESRTTVLDQNESIKTAMDTAQANGFNWAAFNVGNGIHTVDVWGEVSTNTSTSNSNSGMNPPAPVASSTAVVTRRTLIIDPTHATDQTQP